MMINKRLVETVGDAKKYIGRNVALQWCALAANIVIVFAVGNPVSYTHLTLPTTERV